MNIVFVEFIDEAQVLVKRFGKPFFLQPDTKVICLDPRVQVYLKKEGIASQGTEDFFSNEAQQRIVLRTNEWADKIVGEFEFKDKSGLQKTYKKLFLYHVRFYFNHFLRVLEIAEAAAQKNQNMSVYSCVYEGNIEKMMIKNAFIQNEERFLGILLRDYCQAKNIKFSGVNHAVHSSKTFENVLAWIVHTIGQMIAWVHYSIFVHSRANVKTVIVPALSYNMGALIKEIKKDKPATRCVVICDDWIVFKREIKKILNLFKDFTNALFNKKDLRESIIYVDLLTLRFGKNREDQQKLSQALEHVFDSVKDFNYFGVDVARYVRLKIQKGLSGELHNFQHKVEILWRIFKQINPDLLMAMYSIGIYDAMGEISGLLKVPSLNISHGTHVPFNNEFDRIENLHLATGVILNDYQYVAVQTPWTAKFLDVYSDKRPRVYSGPLLYAKVAGQFKEKMKAKFPKLNDFKKIIVHATTQKVRYGLRFHIAETTDEYVSSLRDLVSAVNEIEGAGLVIRPHPITELSTEELLSLLPPSQKIVVIEEGSFSEVLSLADLLVSYSSTCIEEALQNNIPVLLFDKWNRYNHFGIPETKTPQSVVKQPVYYVTQSEILKESIQKISAVFSAETLLDDELTEYKYPKNYRDNYRQFVAQALNGGTH